MKNQTRRVIIVSLGLLWFGLFLISLVILFFSTTPLFYSKIKIDPKIMGMREDSYIFSLPNPLGLYNSDSLIIQEDGEYLPRVFTNDKRYDLEGTFFLNESGDYQISGQIFPSFEEFSGKINHEYIALIKLGVIFGDNVGRIALIIFISGILIYILLMAKEGGKYINLKSTTPFLEILKSILIVKLFRGNQIQLLSKRIILRSLTLILTASFALVFSEWLFLVTKISFLDYFSLLIKLKVLFISFFLTCILSSLLFFVFLLIGSFLFNLLPTISIYLTQIPTAFLLTSLIVLIGDNFFHTIFDFEIGGSFGLSTLLLAIMTIYIFIVFLNQTVTFLLSPRTSIIEKTWITTSFFVIILSMFFSIYQIFQRDTFLHYYPELQTLNLRPNIILISSDGLNANNLSAYGYSRQTTPFLNEFKKISLISLNNFANANQTYGSFVSLLTGRLPITTRVLYPPDILRGEDVYQHLPGILRAIGYSTVSLGSPYYEDANIMNFQNAFNVVNCSDYEDPILSSPILISKFQNESYLLFQIKKRIKERLFHIFFIEEFRSPFVFVNNASKNAVSDHDRLECLETFIEESINSNHPFFIQIHQTSTHGPRFESPIQKFSKNQIQTYDWMTDYYDDSIRNFDMQLSQLYSSLLSMGVAENTIIVVFSDHGTEWNATERIPLLIHFPKNEFAGEISGNTQNLDIAPTLLDYIGLEIPKWMNGSSLLETIKTDRIIYSFESIDLLNIAGLRMLPTSLINGKYKQFAKIYSIQCNQIIIIDLRDESVTHSFVKGYNNPCPDQSLLTPDQIIISVNDLLNRNGYKSLDTSRTE